MWAMLGKQLLKSGAKKVAKDRILNRKKKTPPKASGKQMSEGLMNNGGQKKGGPVPGAGQESGVPEGEAAAEAGVAARERRQGGGRNAASGLRGEEEGDGGELAKGEERGREEEAQVVRHIRPAGSLAEQSVPRREGAPRVLLEIAL